MEGHESNVSSTTPDHDQAVHDDAGSATVAASSLSVKDQPHEGEAAQTTPEGGLVAWLAGKLQGRQQSVR